jgi:hypothetical protein
MIDGLWTVEFRSSVGGLGSGTLIFENGKVMGGDAGYYYVGSYEGVGNTLKGRVTVKKYNPGHISIFGSLNIFTIEISGPLNDAQMTLHGKMAENPTMTISIVCTKRENI